MALVLAAAAVVATFLVDVEAALWTLAAYALFLAYFAVYSRHHLVASAPEEEFALLAAADEEVR
jgi:ethanolamine permease